MSIRRLTLLSLSASAWAAVSGTAHTVTARDTGLTAADRRDATARDPRTVTVDLNGDGQREHIAYLADPDHCGSGGCTLVVLSGRQGSRRLVGRTTVTRLPVRLLRSSHHGWTDLAVTVAGGGTTPSEVILRFDGRRYPSNPTLLPRERRPPAGTVLIAR